MKDDNNSFHKTEDIKAVLEKSIHTGLDNSASIIGNMINCDMNISTVKLYTIEQLNKTSEFTERIAIMNMQGDILSGELIFSIDNDELLKIVMQIDDMTQIDMSKEELNEIMDDAYQEIGNIILGNIISEIVDSFNAYSATLEHRDRKYLNRRTAYLNTMP
jgi:CheY-specific phosphatase CheX